MHVCHGEPSEFTPLSEWMRQSTMFNMLQSIRFFKCYLHSKVSGRRSGESRGEVGVCDEMFLRVGGLAGRRLDTFSSKRLRFGRGNPEIHLT